MDNGIEQRFQIGSGSMRIRGSCSGTARAVQEGDVLQLFFAGIQIHQQFQYFVADFIQSGIRTVNLVDHYNNLESHFQCLGEYETSLRHRAFCGIDQQQGTIYHAQNTFYFTSEVGMSWCINDINLGIPIPNGSIFC